MQLLGLVDTVGAEIEQVERLQVRAVGEAGILQGYIEVVVDVAAPQPTFDVPAGDVLQVLVAAEGFLAHVVELKVIVDADVVEQTQLALMVVNPAVVGSPSHQVLHLVTVFHRHLLGAIALIGIGIFHAEIVFSARIIRRLVGEETLVLAPHPIVEEVLLAVLRDDDFQFGGVAAGKDVVAAEDEVFRPERL